MNQPVRARRMDSPPPAVGTLAGPQPATQAALNLGGTPSLNGESIGRSGLGFKLPEADKLGDGKPDWTKTLTIQWIRIDLVSPDPMNPRKNYGSRALDEMLQSVRQEGIRDPFKVRPGEGQDRCYIIGGHRRLWAVQKLGWSHVPCLVSAGAESRVGQLRDLILDNEHRADFSPIDRALGYKALMDQSGASQSEVARMLSVDPATVGQYLNLLKLPDQVQPLVNTGMIPVSTALLLCRFEEPKILELAPRVIAKQLTNADLESMLGRGNSTRAASKGTGGSRVASNAFATNRKLDLPGGVSVSVQSFRKLDDAGIRAALEQAVKIMGIEIPASRK